MQKHRLREFMRWLLIAFSITAVAFDVLNDSGNLTRGKTLGSDGIHYIALFFVGALLALFSWIGAFEFGFARNDKKWGAAFVWLIVCLGMSGYNMASAKAYMSEGFPFIREVSGPMNLYMPFTGIEFYHTNDWFLDASSYGAAAILLILCFVNMEEKNELSPEEERKELEIKRARLENAKWAAEHLAPLEKETAKNAGSALRSKLEGRLVGMGLMKEKLSDEAVDEPQGHSETAQEEVGADRPVEAVLVALAPEQLTTLQVAKMFGLKSDRSVRARIQNFVDGKPNGIPAHKVQLEGRTTPQWIIYRDELKEACPADWKAYEKRESERNRRKKSRTRDTNNNNPATGPVEIHAVN